MAMELPIILEPREAMRVTGDLQGVFLPMTQGGLLIWPVYVGDTCPGSLVSAMVKARLKRDQILQPEEGNMSMGIRNDLGPADLVASAE
ncbi:hypothetical protein N7540_012982 [Penicillium herquei]|nr:hypothetical protein N7540_012982 [Penicillium herquei]